MATIDQMHKLYSLLTPRERFSLIVAASERDDITERDALVNSAPVKRWGIKDHYGYSQGFNFAAMFYMIEQLGYLTSMYFMMSGSTPGNDGKKYTHIKHDGKEFTIDFDKYGNDSIRAIVANHAGWVKLCNEYKVNPDIVVKHLPHYEIMQLMIAICEGAASLMGSEAQPSEEEIQARYENMRAAVEKFVKDWE